MSRCFLLALLLLSRCLPAGAADRALLIGISQYAELEGLRYADADVKTFSQILVDFGGYSRSDVTVALNTEATKEHIRAEVERIVRESKSAPLNTFIFMFAGHGMPSRMEVGRPRGTAPQRTNIFLAPFDASIAPEAFYSTGDEIVNETFINRAWLARQLAEIKAKSIIIIVDSCYSGTEEFGNLYLENLGYTIRSFDYGTQRPGVREYRRPGNPQQREAADLQQRIAYLASSRGDQLSVEYEELGHGALSYSLFEAIRRARESVHRDEKRDLSVDDVYSRITTLFQETKVKGRALWESHQPVLLPIPNYAEVRDMPFLSLTGARGGEIRKGEIEHRGRLELNTDPPGFEIYIDGARQDQVTPAKLSLQEGKHLVELYTAATGYRYTFTVDISEAIPAVEELILLGRLRVTSFWLVDGKKTAGPVLDLYLDGQSLGKSDQRFDSLVAGTHTLEARYANYSRKRRIEIRPDTPLVVNYSVVREGAAAPRKPAVPPVVY
jgi:Caspase domain